MEQNVSQINGRITRNVNVSVKNIIYVKKIMFGILLHVIVKMKNIYQVLWMIQQLPVMIISESFNCLSHELLIECTTVSFHRKKKQRTITKM